MNAEKVRLWWLEEKSCTQGKVELIAEILEVLDSFKYLQSFCFSKSRDLQDNLAIRVAEGLQTFCA